MLYLNYAKPVGGGNILSFFADSEKDLEQISNGKKFIANNGTDYGVPVDSSTVIITLPDKTKKTYMLSSGEWIEGVKEEPAFQEEYDVTSYGASDEYIMYGLHNNAWGINNIANNEELNEKLWEALKESEPFGAIQKSGGYFVNSSTAEENSGHSEFGRIIEWTAYGANREFLKSGSKYRVRLYPKIYLYPNETDNVNKFYQWVCRYKRLSARAYMVNEDCELSDEELMNFSEDASASDLKNPDILFKFGFDLESMPTGTFCENIMTKKECVYFLLEVVEIQ